MMRMLTGRLTRRGGALVDASVAVVTIAILVVAALVAYKGEAEQSRRNAARADIEALAQAELKALAGVGHFVPLQVLDNVEAGKAVDAIDSEPAGVLAIDAKLTRESAAPAEQPPVASLAASWKGPLHQPARVRLGTDGSEVPGANQDSGLAHRDYPLDPWGGAYRFYSPIGLIGSQANSTDPAALNSTEFADGKITTNDDRFDVYAIVSYGPDGQSDAVSGADDDVIYLFPGEAAGQ